MSPRLGKSVGDGIQRYAQSSRSMYDQFSIHPSFERLDWDKTLLIIAAKNLKHIEGKVLTHRLTFYFCLSEVNVQIIGAFICSHLQ